MEKNGNKDSKEGKKYEVDANGKGYWVQCGD